MPSHRLHHKYPAVGTGRGSQPVNFLRNHIQSGLKTESVIRFHQVFINGLGNAHHVDTFLCQLPSHAERIVPTDSNQRIQAQLFNVVQHQLRAVVLGIVGIGPGSPQHGAAISVPGPYFLLVQRADIVPHFQVGICLKHEAAPAIPDAEHLVPDSPFRFQPPIISGLDRPLDRRIEASAVATAGQDADSLRYHGNSL